MALTHIEELRLRLDLINRSPIDHELVERLLDERDDLIVEASDYNEDDAELLEWILGEFKVRDRVGKPGSKKWICQLPFSMHDTDVRSVVKQLQYDYPGGLRRNSDTPSDNGEPCVFDPCFPDGIEQTSYKIFCDDKGRNRSCWLAVNIAHDGDVHVIMQDWEDIAEPGSKPSPIPSIRIRTHGGGGRNHRTRQALLWLADAIRRDNLENGVSDK